MKALLLLATLSLFSSALSAQAPEATDPGDAQMPQTMEQMQARMQTMREQMARIHATEDPQERQRLMQAHMQSMHEGMRMMGETMRGPRGQGQMRQCREDDTECRMNQMQMQQQMMGQRMGMMQQMMEQMTERMMQEQTGETPAAENHDEHH